MNAAEAVAAILEQTGETKSSLSRRSGVSRALIDDYLKGRRQPTVAQLERLGESVGLRLDLEWDAPVTVEVDRRSDPSWPRADNPEMRPMPLTVEQRARVLERVVPVAMAQRRRVRGDLEFPPFRSLLRERAARG